MTAVRVVRLEEEVVEGKRLGRHVEHDERSRAYAVEEMTAPAIHEVHHRSHGAVLDQGNLGSCTGNAMAGAINTDPVHRLGESLLTEANAVSIYEAATVIDGIDGVYPPTDTGSSGLAVAKVAKSRGEIAGYSHAFSILGAVSALMKVPVITGVPWYEGFDHPDPTTGMVEIAGQIRGGHEFRVIGFVPASSGDLLDGVAIAVNSWGRDWGINGRFRFTARTWAELLAEDGDVTVPVPIA